MKKNFEAFLLPIFLVISISLSACAQPTVNLNGKTYFLTYAENRSGTLITAEVWFRVSLNASSVDDIKAFHMTFSQGDMAEFENKVCAVKNLYDGGKTIVGCVSVIGSVFCAVGTAATDGALATVCTATWDYALDKGAADCIEGVTDAFITSLGKGYEWEVLGTAAGVADPQLSEAIKHAINLMCENVKNNSQ